MNIRVLVLVALITAFAPLSMDLYLPGLPDLRAELGASDQEAQLTVTLCIVGLAVGQFMTSLIPGRFGRRPPLVAGLAGWVIATVLCALAPNIPVILALRLCQGLGAGIAIALARTVVADLDPDNLSAQLSRMMLVLSVVPVLAPVVGGVVVSVMNWRGLFGGLAATGAALLLVVILALPESHQPGQQPDAGEPLFGPVKHLVRSPAFLLPAVISGTGFGVTFSFVGDSAFVFRGHYGLAPVPYGLIFGLDALAMIAGLQAGPILERRIGTKAVLLAATSTGAFGALAMLVFAVVTPHAVALVVAALMVTLLGGGAVIPVATAAAIDAYPGDVSAASGLCGAFQFALGGVLGALPTLLPFGDGAGPLAVVCLICVAAGHALSRDLERAPRRNAPSGQQCATLIAGTVEHGDQRGRELGYPTANLPVAECVAGDGVWAGTVTLGDGSAYAAAVSVGRRATFYGRDGIRLVEAHLLDFDGDLYGQWVEVRLCSRLRLQRRFPDAGALVEQMRQDVADTRAWAAAGALSYGA